MTITLRPEQEEVIARALRSGAYRDIDDVIGRALEALRAEDEWLLENRDVINEKIARAIDQLGRGEGISSSELKTRLQQRKSDWLNQPKP